MIAVGGDGVDGTVVGHEGHETVSVGPDGSVIKVQTEVVGQELIEADDVQEVDVRDMRSVDISLSRRRKYFYEL